MNEKLFIDTAGLIAVFNEQDHYHDEGQHFWEEKLLANLENWSRIYLSDYILDETATVLQRKIHHDRAVKVLDRLIAFIESGYFEIVWVDQDRFYKILDTFQTFREEGYSLTDCSSFQICDAEEINLVFTFDTEDFSGAGLIPVPESDL